MLTKEEILALSPGARVRMPNGSEAEVRTISQANETVTLFADEKAAAPKAAADEYNPPSMHPDWNVAPLGPEWGPPKPAGLTTTIVCSWQHLRDANVE